MRPKMDAADRGLASRHRRRGLAKRGVPSFPHFPTFPLSHVPRTLAGPTKQGFTGKEQDAETGLDYFGARYYMPALARWTAVDPLGEKHPEWSPYNYVLNNPLMLIDPDGRQISADFGDFNPFGPFGDYRKTPDGRIERRTDYHEARARGAVIALSLLPVAQAAEGVVSTVIDILTGSFSVGGTVLNFLPGPSVKQVDEVVEATGDAVRTTGRIGGDQAQAPIREGIYEFPDQTAGGVPYVGQSGNIAERLPDHVRAGRLDPGTERVQQVPGGQTAREIAEHRRIQQLTGGVPARRSPNVANKKDPIGPRRLHLLEKEKKP